MLCHAMLGDEVGLVGCACWHLTVRYVLGKYHSSNAAFESSISISMIITMLHT